MEREGDHEVAMQLASDSVQGQEIYSHLRQCLSDGLQEAGHGKGEHRGACQGVLGDETGCGSLYKVGSTVRSFYFSTWYNLCLGNYPCYPCSYKSGGNA